ncbi:hypothetical protein MMC22_001465 [Lobaria immixta]|nr:hypothetical protein [Lobaria immixta]
MSLSCFMIEIPYYITTLPIRTTSEKQLYSQAGLDDMEVFTNEQRTRSSEKAELEKQLVQNQINAAATKVASDQAFAK